MGLKSYEDLGLNFKAKPNIYSIANPTQPTESAVSPLLEQEVKAELQRKPV